MDILISLLYFLALIKYCLASNLLVHGDHEPKKEAHMVHMGPTYPEHVKKALVKSSLSLSCSSTGKGHGRVSSSLQWKKKKNPYFCLHTEAFFLIKTFKLVITALSQHAGAGFMSYTFAVNSF